MQRYPSKRAVENGEEINVLNLTQDSLPYPYLIAILAGSSNEIGGTEMHILSLIKYNDRKRFRFLIIAPPSLLNLVEELNFEGVEGVEWTLKTKFSAKAALRMKALLLKKGVNLLHIHDARSGILGRLVAKSLRIPVVYTVHLPPYYYAAGLRRWVYQLIERLLNRWFTDRIIYVSHRVYQEALRLNITPRDRSMVIENGIDLYPYNKTIDRKAVRKALSTPEDATVFCFVGRLTEQKGLDVLLRAVAEIRNQRTCFRLWIIGDGPLRGELEHYASEQNLVPTVQFLGFKDNVPMLLKASDVFVLPSRYEAMPISLLEAMASGLPCVVTDVGDNAELVEDGVTGIVVPPNDPDALAIALEKMLFNSEIRRLMGEAARRKAQEYSIEQMVTRITSVYEELLLQRS